MTDSERFMTDEAITRVLIVEDSDTKYSRLESVVRDCLPKTTFMDRASTVTEAESKIEDQQWAGLILDISMNITKSSAGPKQGGHATLGGLGIAKKMYLLGREVPTVIVTAFDSFEETTSERTGYNALGLEDVERRATDTLGAAFVGCVRYGEAGWETKLKACLKKVWPC